MSHWAFEEAEVWFEAWRHVRPWGSEGRRIVGKGMLSVKSLRHVMFGDDA